MKKHRHLIAVVVALLLVSLILSCAPAPAPPPAPAPEWPPPKPKLIIVSTYDIGSNMHLRSAMMAEAIDKKFGVTMRVVPIGTDVARVMSVKTGSTNFWVTGSGVYTTNEGLGEYAFINWGPQPSRYAYLCNRKTGFGPGATKDSGIKTMADVRGKRVAWVVGNPGLQLQYGAWLSFAGLTWDDVEVVEFPSYTAAVRGLIEGKVDMTGVDTVAPIAAEVAASPHGLYWIPLPKSDVEGWKRIQAIFPLCTPLLCSIGTGIDPKKPIEFVTIPAPTFVTFDWVDEGLCYWMTKLIAESHEGMEHPSWWSVDESLSAGRCAPFHKGAVEYFKEIGKWTDEQEKRDQELLNWQKVLGEAFEVAKAESLEKGITAKEFPDFWTEKRLEALKAAGF